MKHQLGILLCLSCISSEGRNNLALNTPVILTLPNVTSRHYNPFEIAVPPSQYGFVITQLHSQYRPVVTSYKENSVYGNYYNSTNTGILKMLVDSELNFKVFVGVNSSYFVNAVMFSIPSVKNSPVPGACCITCSLEIDPNIKIKYDSFKTFLSFQRASTFWMYPNSYPQCDDQEIAQTFRLKYDIYYYFLTENDLSEDGLFKGVWKMSTPERIEKHGTHLATIKLAGSLSATTERLFGQGVIFNVIVTDPLTGSSAAYVPAATYACNFTSSKSDECRSKGSLTSLIFNVAFAALGIVMCFAGFKLFRLLLFLSGMVFWWLIIFVVLARYCNEWSSDELLIISSLISLIGGAMMLFVYVFKKVFYVCILVVCMSVGLFISSIIFYTPFGYYEFWNVYYRFLLGYLCLALFITILFLFYPKTICYLFSSLLGSYAIILLPNYFLRANMQYIIVTVLLRMTVEDFGLSYLRRPYQKLDYILTASWAALFVAGYIVQYCTSKNDEFEVSGREIRQKAWGKFSESLRISRKSRRSKKKQKPKYYVPEESERTPLITNQDDTPNTFITFGHSNVPYQPYGTTENEYQLPPAHSHESREYTPLLHHAHPSAPVDDGERYPKYAAYT